MNNKTKTQKSWVAMIDGVFFYDNVIDLDCKKHDFISLGYTVNVAGKGLLVNHTDKAYVNSVVFTKNITFKNLIISDNSLENCKSFHNLSYISHNNYQLYSNLTFINKYIKSLYIYSLNPINFIFIDTFVKKIICMDKSKLDIVDRRNKSISEKACQDYSITIVNKRTKEIYKEKNFDLSRISNLIRKYSPRWIVG